MNIHTSRQKKGDLILSIAYTCKLISNLCSKSNNREVRMYSCHAVEKAGVIAQLVDFVDTLDATVSIAAAEALLSVVHDSPERCNLVLRAGGMQRFLRIRMSKQTPTHAMSVIRAVISKLLTHGSKNLITQEELRLART